MYKRFTVKKTKATKKNNSRKVRKSRERDQNKNRLRKKKAYEKEIKDQIKSSNEFIERVNGVLSIYGRVLDTNGRDSLGVESENIIKVLDSINEDLEDFYETFEKLNREAEEFFADNSAGDIYSWLPTTVDLVYRFDQNLTQYTELFILNHRTLLSYDH